MNTNHTKNNVELPYSYFGGIEKRIIDAEFPQMENLS